jgi:acyl-CoA reductase-like NAD-dependent aldehyde dehydrogenase
MRITLLFATLVLAGATLDATAGGEVFRWTDEKGIAHYTDMPPASGKYERVNVRTGGASTVAQAKDEAPTDAAAADGTGKKTPAQERAERCQAARANLSALQSNLEVSVEENGKPRALTEEERLEHADRSERIIASDCDTL